MRNGSYATYNEKEYFASQWDENQVRLVSYDKRDEALGFKKKIYPDNYLNVGELPIIYIKIVKWEELEEFYTVEYLAEYHGEKYWVRDSMNRNNIILGTDSAAIAAKNQFLRTDKYFYEKEVLKSEVKIEAVKKYLIKKNFNV
ncbi:hypothetical protein [Enterococcus sp. LJL51]|uniref:hypothetical protein n=1 Tax=Enterococcus sp. LJL51 TaxID=3416656 RepID=UPI003CEEA5BD